MGVGTLSQRQTDILNILASNSAVTDRFYLGGGTALAEFYLHHRFSEDFDFFSIDEFDVMEIQTLFRQMKKTIRYESIDIQQSFNRNLFFIKFADQEVIKIEFTYYPFGRIEKGLVYKKLSVDSLKDIAVNKLFTIYQNPRSRDYIDLYCILQKEKFTLEELYRLAKIKFDWHIDMLQLGARFMQAKEVKDFPRMIIELSDEKWIGFFIKLARKIGDKM